MAFDIHLSELCKIDETFLRVYRWEPYCISLGLNQSTEVIDAIKAEHDNIDIVTRPTGGRAILHAEELTYSVVMPVVPNSSPQKIYKEINSALALGLNIYDESLSCVELENSQPNFREYYKEKRSDVCFAVSAKSELKFNGQKLVGSAQHRFGNIILQHGSILCGNYHKKIIDYLKTSIEDRRLILYYLNHTADLHSITRKKVDYEHLISSIREGFESYYRTTFNNSAHSKFYSVENKVSFS